MTVPVSVIIPYYNAEKYFDEALTSVKNQTVPPAQIIVIDDGSNKKSQEFLDSYSAEFDLIRLKTNKGPGFTRNAGIAKATQPYIAFMDSDDIWVLDKLEAQYKYMENHPVADVSHTGSIIFDEHGNEKTASERPQILSIEKALEFHEMMTPSIMIKREVIESINGFNPRIKCAQDWELQVRLALSGFQIHYLPQILLRVRRQNHGNHSSKWHRFLIGHLKILLIHRREYIKHFGLKGWISLISREMARAGYRQKGLIGHTLKIPSKLGL